MKSEAVFSISLTVVLLVFAFFLFQPEADPRFPSHCGPAQKFLDLNWNGYPYEVDQPITRGTPGIPFEVSFGQPIVRTAVGPFSNWPLELDPPQELEGSSQVPYAQIRIPMELGAEAYFISFEAAILPSESEPAAYDFTLFLDGNSTHSLKFDWRGEVRAIVTPNHSGEKFVTIPPRERFRIEAFLDLSQERVSFKVNEAEWTGPTFGRFKDLTGIRISFRDSLSGGAVAAIDNLEIYSFMDSNKK